MIMIDDTAGRQKAAHEKLLRALRKAGAKVGRPDKSHLLMHEIDGVRVWIYFYAGHGMKTPVPLRLRFGQRWGKRQPVLREPKLGFNYALLAERVLTYVREERARLDAKKAAEVIRTANQRLAIKLTKVHKLRETGISVRHSYDDALAGVINVEVCFEDLTAAKANRIIRSLKRLVPPVKTKS